jgi:hypothetical protein
MLKDQAKSIHKLESIQIDLTFKRVKGNINEFEINSYSSKHKLSKLFDIYFHFYILQNLIIIYYLFYIQFSLMLAFIQMLLQLKDISIFLQIFLM